MTFDDSQVLQSIENLLRGVGYDFTSPEMKDTPMRVRDYWKERLSGREIDLSKELVAMPGELTPCPIILEHVPFTSTCEHHLAPFEGEVTLGYLPGAHGIVGLSKLVRVVQAFAWRLQVQERMTHQIARALEDYLKPEAWAVKVVGTHTCMSHRGVKTPHVPVTTVVLGGRWKDDPPSQFA